MKNRKSVAVVIAIVTASVSLSGCINSKRQIDPQKTNSFSIEGISWRGFCQGANAFIYVPGKNDSDPDELEAVIYDHYICVKGLEDMKTVSPSPSTSSKPDADPDGIIDDED